MNKITGSERPSGGGKPPTGSRKAAPSGDGGGRPGAGARKGPGDAGGWSSTTGKESGGNRSNGKPK